MTTLSKPEEERSKQSVELTLRVKHNKTAVFANTEDPDEMAHDELFHLDIYSICIFNKI